MTTRLHDTESGLLAATVAPEDLRRGNFVGILNQIVELPTFFWSETLCSERDELVRIRRLPTDDRLPLKVKAVCLPFVFVKSPKGEFQTIDIRLTTLVRLDKQYAKTVWKKLKPAKPEPTPAV